MEKSKRKNHHSTLFVLTTPLCTHSSHGALFFADCAAADPFLVITSNCWAVMGLRSLFFVLSALQNMFKYLQHGVAVILAFVGCKMILGYFGFHINTAFMLTFMVSVLAISMKLSVDHAKASQS